MLKLCSVSRIPDLVKDPEAEAAFEALRGLVEASLQKAFQEQEELKRARANKKPTARKSTTKRRSPSPEPPVKRPKLPLVKGLTARKSTGSRMMGGRGEFSYYGFPFEPVDFAKVSTRMSIGGVEITLNAGKLADLGVNLQPKVVVRDCEA